MCCIYMIIAQTKLYCQIYFLDGWFMVFNATFNNILVISWRRVLFVEETGVPVKTHIF